ncbi:MAG: protein translocase SEC61 complex subunit gamma [Candidatus Diapherotrites archaeon]|nr:protein translocase SEC61 complex subunit gamma [Candidatus Diapherotrites archaeon]
MAEEAEHPSQEKPLDGRSKDEKKPVFGQQSTGFKGPGIGARIQHFIADAKRIFHVSRKPDRKEFTGMLKITALGIVLIGIIGFIIHFIFAFLGL